VCDVNFLITRGDEGLSPKQRCIIRNIVDKSSILKGAQYFLPTASKKAANVVQKLAFNCQKDNGSRRHAAVSTAGYDAVRPYGPGPSHPPPGYEKE
jgi:hypothetical protein